MEILKKLFYYIGSIVFIICFIAMTFYMIWTMTEWWGILGFLPALPLMAGGQIIFPIVMAIKGHPSTIPCILYFYGGLIVSAFLFHIGKPTKSASKNN